MSVYDPTCGSGGMLIQTRDYIRECGGDPKDISFFGQESMGTTWSICKMNMLLHGIPDSAILNRLRFVQPSLDEQDRIADRVRALDSKRKAEMAHRDILIKQKHGLMRDLLTGRVRVKVDS